MLHIPQHQDETSDHRVGHFGPYKGTVRTMGLDSSVGYLSPKCLLDTLVLVLKCLDSLDTSVQCRSVSLPNWS